MYKAKYERNNEITVTSLMSEKSVQFKSHGLILSWYVYTIYHCQDQLLDKAMLKFRQSITLCDIATVKEWIQTFLPLSSMTSLKPVNNEILHNLPSSIDVPFIKMIRIQSGQTANDSSC